ncbi:iron hydrogenase [Scenedesmus sp. NREL 46B-D3]|nr:iron hydrogenase [Scenedesmus sp. NREL 46B-D3]
MAAFSTAVKLGDLNDFIAPAQACVVSLQGQKPATKADEPSLKVGQEGLKLNVRATSKRHEPEAVPETPQKKVGFQQTVVDDDTQAIKVSLNDCLACSGCVTSAETVLLQHQSLKEFVSKCGDPDTIVVVSVSPQSRASLAALHGLSPEDVQGRLSTFLKHQLSVGLVLDLGLGSALALTEAAAEFVARYKARQQQRSAAVADGGAAANSGAAAAAGAGPLPVLASACPGWVCYAEKTHGSYILPYIAATRSPQGIMGSLVKQLLAPLKGWDPSHVYHVSVMPCYDKKLEASRDDFNVPGLSVPEVDSCLTTGELQELLEKHGYKNMADLPGGRADNLTQLLQQAHNSQQQQQQGSAAAAAAAAGVMTMPEERLREPTLHAQVGSSGGYAEHIFAAAAQHLFGVQLQPTSAGPQEQQQQQQQQQQRLPFKVLRNADMQELQLLGPDGQVLLRFATAYGFRNIQTLVRKIKAGRCEYDYVEVMACPSGCLNGGGQIKAPAGVSSAAHIEQLELLYFRQQALAAEQQPQQQQQQQYSLSPGLIQLHSLLPLPQQQVLASSPSNDSSLGAADWSWAVPGTATPAALAAVYGVLLGGGPGSAAAQPLLHTQYHQREKTVTSTIADW